MVAALRVPWNFLLRILTKITLLMHLHRIEGSLHLGEIPLVDVARFAGTPVYVYSWDLIEKQFVAVQRALSVVPHQIHYAVKANSNIALLKRLAAIGCGFDIVSGGELERVLCASVNPSKVILSGVGKSDAEISFALKTDVGCINVESEQEFRRIQSLVNRLNIAANIALRINPEIDVDSHPYLVTASNSSKFGIPTTQVDAVARAVSDDPRINLIGISCHLGSQIQEAAPYKTALTRMLRLVDRWNLMGNDIQTVNIGGGFAINYRNEQEFCFDELGDIVQEQLSNRSETLCIEPGRFLVGASGVLLTQVEYLKKSDDKNAPNFVIVDAGMNDLIRPTLYDSWHDIDVVEQTDVPSQSWNVVGPLCESGDFLGLDRELAIDSQSLLAIGNVGAYGFALSSNYNSRPRAAEVLVEGSKMHLIRDRESMHDLLKLERLGEN